MCAKNFFLRPPWSNYFWPPGLPETKLLFFFGLMYLPITPDIPSHGLQTGKLCKDSIICHRQMCSNNIVCTCIRDPCISPYPRTTFLSFYLFCDPVGEYEERIDQTSFGPSVIFSLCEIAINAFKLSTMVGKKIDFYLSQIAINAFKLSTMVGENLQ